MDTPIGPLTKLALWPMCDLFACGILQTGQLEAVFLGGIRKKPGETSKFVFNVTSSSLFGNREEAGGIVHSKRFLSCFELLKLSGMGL